MVFDGSRVLTYKDHAFIALRSFYQESEEA